MGRLTKDQFAAVFCRRDARLRFEGFGEVLSAAEAGELGDGIDGVFRVAEETFCDAHARIEDAGVDGAAGDAAEAALEFAAGERDGGDDVIDADWAAGVAIDEAGGAGDERIADGEFAGRAANDESAGRDEDGIGLWGSVFQKIVKE